MRRENEKSGARTFGLELVGMEIPLHGSRFWLIVFVSAFTTIVITKTALNESGRLIDTSREIKSLLLIDTSGNCDKQIFTTMARSAIKIEAEGLSAIQVAHLVIKGTAQAKQIAQLESES